MQRVFRALVGALSVWLSACASGREPAPAPASDGGPLGTGEVHIRVVDAANGQPVRCKLLLTAAGETLPIGPAGVVGAWIAPHVLATDRVVYGDPCDLN